MTFAKPFPLIVMMAMLALQTGCDREPGTGADSSESPMSDSTANAGQAEVSQPVQGAITKERVTKAWTCQIELSSLVGVKIAGADTGLPADLNARLGVSAITPWEDFANAHSAEAGFTDQDREVLVGELFQLKAPTEKEREARVALVRDCLDTQP